LSEAVDAAAAKSLCPALLSSIGAWLGQASEITEQAA